MLDIFTVMSMLQGKQIVLHCVYVGFITEWELIDQKHIIICISDSNE